MLHMEGRAAIVSPDVSGRRMVASRNGDTDEPSLPPPDATQLSASVSDEQERNMDIFQRIKWGFFHVRAKIVQEIFNMVASTSEGAPKPIAPLDDGDSDLHMAKKAEEAHVLVTPLEVSDKTVGIFNALTGNDPMTHFALLLRKGDRFFVFERVTNSLSLRAVGASDIRGLGEGSRLKPRGDTSIENFIRDEKNLDYHFTGNNCKHFVYKFYWHACERANFEGGDRLDIFSFCGYVEHLHRLDEEEAVAAMS